MAIPGIESRGRNANQDHLKEAMWISIHMILQGLTTIIEKTIFTP